MTETIAKPTPQEIEQQTLKLGKFLLSQMDRRRPTMLDPRWWDDKMMRQLTSDDALKTQMFRFVDVLPTLKTHQTINRHLHEYFEEVKTHLPWAVKLGLDLTDNNPIFSRVLSYSARANARRMAHRFIAGTTASEVLDSLKKLRNQGYAFTLDLMGEAVITPHEADQYQQQYLNLMRDLAPNIDGWIDSAQVDSDHFGPVPRMNISLKISALDHNFNPIDPQGTIKRVGEKLRPILDLARDLDVFVNIDMEQYAYKDVTYRLFKEIMIEPEYRDWAHVGIVCQAYLTESTKDLADLLKWVEKRGTPITVRLVKGAYWDYETVNANQRGWVCPVYTEKWQTDENFERLSDYLLENYRWLKPAFGSHNLRSLAHVMASAKCLGVPEDAYEVQMLYGMGGEAAQIIADEGVRVRVYTPFGEMISGMAYLVRRLLENTSNESFLRHAYAHDISQEELMKSPTIKGREKSRPSNLEPLSFQNEPFTDLTQPANQKLMQDALEKVRDELGASYGLSIGGKSIDTRNNLTSTNPANKSEVIGKVALANTDQVDMAVDAARTAYYEWSKITPKYRAEYLELIATRLQERRFEMCAWMILETGKTWAEADAEVAESIDFCRYYALEIQRIHGEQLVHLPGEENESFYRPRGVAVVIAPWNFPLAILTGMTVAAIVSGNTVIMKPAEQSSVVAAKLMEIIREAHVTEGVVNFLPGIGEDIGPYLVSHPGVDLVAFTGSREVGLAINHQAAEPSLNMRQVKRVIAEMGGKNAIIIDDDADLDEAVRGVIESGFNYSGQKCSACSRVIVVSGIYDEFLARLKGAVEGLIVGPPADASTEVGPVIDQEAKDRIEQEIQTAITEMQTVLVAKDVSDLVKKGHFVGPHVFKDVLPTSRLAQEEIFGPVLAVIRAKDFGEALSIANNTRYALTGAVFSRSPENLKRARMEFQVGNLYLNRNCTGALVYRQPFGGYKMSGIGSKAGGPDYLLQFLIPVCITENTLRRGFTPAEENAK